MNPVIAVTYDVFYQTMTVTGTAGSVVETKDSNGNVIGSGVIGPDGTVTYPLNIEGLVNGSEVFTSGLNANIVVSTLSLSTVITFKAEADSYGELPVVINFEGGSARVDFGDGSEVLEHTDSVEHTYPASPVEGELVSYSITLTPTSRIPLLSTDIRELTDWGSSGIVKRFKFLHPAPKVPNFIPSWLIDTSHMFEMCQGFSQDLSDWDVSNVTNMSYMFRECRSQSSDLSNWNVSKVTDMKHMFEQSGNFSGSLENWDTSNVTDMSYMFSYGAAHNPLSIGSWDVSKVTDMNNMFNKAHSFNNDLSAWDVSNVVDMNHMFAECHALFKKTTPVGYWSLENWDVSKVTNMERMFYYCINGVPSNISRWQTGNVTNMKETFSHCNYMSHLTFWDTSKVTTMEGMFEASYQFNSDIGNWDVSNVTNMDNMFKGVQWMIVSLEKWCVEKISEEPIGFAPDADYMPDENKPVWGTCPNPI